MSSKRENGRTLLTMAELMQDIEDGLYLDIQDAVQWYGVLDAEWQPARSCNCGSGQPWTNCPGNGESSSYCG